MVTKTFHKNIKTDRMSKIIFVFYLLQKICKVVESILHFAANSFDNIWKNPDNPFYRSLPTELLKRRGQKLLWIY